MPTSQWPSWRNSPARLCTGNRTSFYLSAAFHFPEVISLVRVFRTIRCLLCQTIKPISLLSCCEAVVRISNLSFFLLRLAGGSVNQTRRTLADLPYPRPHTSAQPPAPDTKSLSIVDPLNFHSFPQRAYRLTLAILNPLGIFYQD